jgi:hypothetical protein
MKYYFVLNEKAEFCRTRFILILTCKILSLKIIVLWDVKLSEIFRMSEEGMFSIFYSEDGGRNFHRNLCKVLPD